MYKVISKFKDITNPRHIYNVGDEFISDDKKRIKNLIDRKFIVEVKNKSKTK